MFRPVLAIPLVVLGLWAQEPGAAPRFQPGVVQTPSPRVPSTAEERAVVLEMTKIRMFPRAYAKYLRALGLRFDGALWRLRDHVPIRTQEGRKAILEAAEFLEQVEPIPGPLRFSEGLHDAARDHVLDQGPTGQTGHVGADGSTFQERIRRHGQQDALIGEVINYGEETPRMTVIQLVIDDGVPGRGHRKNIFNPDFKVAGAAIGYHRGYGAMTVVDMADAFTEK